MTNDIEIVNILKNNNKNTELFRFYPYFCQIIVEL